jgi:hypothetical protein
MRPDFKDYAPALFIVGGASLTVIALAAIKLVYPDQSEYLPYQPVCMAIALGTAYWFGRNNGSQIPIVAYPLWGLVFALLSGFLGMQYLTLRSYIPTSDTYLKAAPWGVMTFVLLVAQSFAIGGLGAEWSVLHERPKSLRERLRGAAASVFRRKRDRTRLGPEQRAAIWAAAITTGGGVATSAITALSTYLGHRSP